MTTYSLKIADIKRETTDTVTICFKQPALKKVKYRAGQYLTLVFRINGRRYLRPYSFSSAPETDSYIEITVKRILGGLVSNHICDEVKIGDIVEVMPPLGDFIFDESKYTFKPQVVLWGAGSGVTPLFSIAKSALSKANGTHVTLVYGNRNHESVIFSDKLKELQHLHKGNFSVWHFHTQLIIDHNNPTIVQGRINPKKVLSVMQDESDINNTIHYICGPTGLKESVKAALNNLNIPEEHIFSEDFELVKDPKDFEDIVTRTIEIDFNNKTQMVEVAKGKSILEACLDVAIELPYSCQTGSCALCKAALTAGQVKTINTKEKPDELKDDEYLLCCSYPLTENIKLSVQ
jgi:ring-1,2-phenylacetyl-CoA epoxidase subunit PaaE